jgi:hypothetical protein
MVNHPDRQRLLLPMQREHKKVRIKIRSILRGREGINCTRVHNYDQCVAIKTA